VQCDLQPEPRATPKAAGDLWMGWHGSFRVFSSDHAAFATRSQGKKSRCKQGDFTRVPNGFPESDATALLFSEGRDDRRWTQQVRRRYRYELQRSTAFYPVRRDLAFGQTPTL